MTYVVTEDWRARAGAQERLAALCVELAEASRTEPGNHFYEAHRWRSDRRRFSLYAEYADHAAYRAHRASEHYTRLVVGEAIPELLDAQARETFEAASRLIDLSPATADAPPNRHAGRHSGSALRSVSDDDDRVIGTAVVLDLTPIRGRATIDVAMLERCAARLRESGEAIRPGDILLLRTDWTAQALGSPRWFRQSPRLGHDAAAWLVAQAPKCLGCDFFEAEAPVQRQILAAGIPLVDGLVNLAELPARCEFFAPFCDFTGSRNVPLRAVAWIWQAPRARSFTDLLEDPFKKE